MPLVVPLALGGLAQWNIGDVGGSAVVVTAKDLVLGR